MSSEGFSRRVSRKCSLSSSYVAFLIFLWCQPLTVIVSSIIDWFSSKALATSLGPSSTFSFLITWFLCTNISSFNLNFSLLVSPTRLPTNDLIPTRLVLIVRSDYVSRSLSLYVLLSNDVVV